VIGLFFRLFPISLKDMLKKDMPKSSISPLLGRVPCWLRRAFALGDTWLFPKRCGHCGEAFEKGLSNILCRKCFDAIPRYEDPICRHCGIGLPPDAFEGALKPHCSDCGAETYALDACRSYGPYEGSLRLAHHAFKFEGMEHLGGVLGRRAASLASRFEGIEALVPVPVRPERERERGYHPARVLALEISKITGYPVGEYLRKVIPTKPQVDLDKKERLRNLWGAFEYVGPKKPNERVLLVDDVYTTGGTLEECAETLKMAGVVWVGAVVLGRTPHHSSQEPGGS
jgi:ComF family protein